MMYAVAFQKRTIKNGRRVWSNGEIYHTAAPDAATARAGVIKMHKERIKIIAVGPVVGGLNDGRPLEERL